MQTLNKKLKLNELSMGMSTVIWRLFNIHPHSLELGQVFLEKEIRL